MRARKRGQILMVASLLSFLGVKNFGVYSAAKAYALRFSDALHRELKNDGVVVTALCPGMSDTGFAESANNPALKMVMMQPQPVVRAGIRALQVGRVSVAQTGSICSLHQDTGVKTQGSVVTRAFEFSVIATRAKWIGHHTGNFTTDTVDGRTETDRNFVVEGIQRSRHEATQDEVGGKRGRLLDKIEVVLQQQGVNEWP